MVMGMLLSCKRERSGGPLLHGGFAALMELYEQNYLLARRLIPAIPDTGVCRTARLDGALDLHLRVLERHPYTSDLCLTYRFPRPDGCILEPDLRLRIYHDARTAEAMTAQLRQWTLPPGSAPADARARWRLNRFLMKWLRYCLHQGYRF